MNPPTTAAATMQPCGHAHTWPRPAACDPEPAPEAGTAAWHAWRLREQGRLTPEQLLPVHR
jgi:hypothetical protein